jgi:hypothetical protein
MVVAALTVVMDLIAFALAVQKWALKETIVGCQHGLYLRVTRLRGGIAASKLGFIFL